jgi:hypothetical protein
MSDRASILLLDDGELEDVRGLLAALGAEPLVLRGGAIPERVEPPRDLFVASGRRAVVASRWAIAPGAGPAKLAVVAEDSNALREMLRRAGFDFLVRRPVHAEALRLLLLHCLFRGEEKRHEPRSVIGREVAYRVGSERRTAVLAELSVQGLRLVANAPLPAGTHVTVQFPGKLGGPFSVGAQVVRTDEGSTRDGRFVLALGIDPADREGQRRMQELVRDLRGGPLALAPVARAARAPAPDGGGPRERRRHRRAQYRRSIMAVDPARPRVLVGRDLSCGGMRVDPDADLTLGRGLRLAIYGAAREEPLLVAARVIRSDAKDGAALQFEGLDAEAARRVERLVALLPSVESLRDGEAGSVGTVITELLGSER